MDYKRRMRLRSGRLRLEGGGQVVQRPEPDAVVVAARHKCLVVMAKGDTADLCPMGQELMHSALGREIPDMKGAEPPSGGQTEPQIGFWAKIPIPGAIPNP